MKEDLEGIGRALDLYWVQKKKMAPGCEPAFVRRMMDAFAPLAYGQSLAGAGGGGFMYVITKAPDAIEKLRAAVADLPELSGVVFHAAVIDKHGLQVFFADN